MALVLSRRAVQAFLIKAPDGTRIRVQVIGIEWPPNRYPKARLAIDAPQDYEIMREEAAAR